MLFYDSCTGHFFASSKDKIEEAQDSVNRIFLEELNNVETMGAVCIPRGLSDEEVLKRYHDPEENALITKGIRNDLYREAYNRFYRELGLNPPSLEGLDFSMDDM